MGGFAGSGAGGPVRVAKATATAAGAARGDEPSSPPWVHQY